MGRGYDERVVAHSESIRNLSQGTARICRSRFGDAWRGLFKFKAAEELAFRSGCSLRTAAYQLSGEQEPSARALAALINECLKVD